MPAAASVEVDLAAGGAGADRYRYVLGGQAHRLPHLRRDRRAVGRARAVAPVALGDDPAGARMVAPEPGVDDLRIRHARELALVGGGGERLPQLAEELLEELEHDVLVVRRRCR